MRCVRESWLRMPTAVDPSEPDRSRQPRPTPLAASRASHSLTQALPSRRTPMLIRTWKGTTPRRRAPLIPVLDGRDGGKSFNFDKQNNGNSRS